MWERYIVTGSNEGILTFPAVVSAPPTPRFFLDLAFLFESPVMAAYAQNENRDNARAKLTQREFYRWVDSLVS